MNLSVVIPVYNCAAYLLDRLESLRKYLAEIEREHEIIIVNDGSYDNTLSLLESRKMNRLKVVNLPVNQGKFAALKSGMALAQGRCRIFTDGDLPFDLEALSYVRDLTLERDFHLVIGDRSLSQSEYKVHLSAPRRFGTEIFSLVVRMLVTGGLFDTQCGLKGFRADVAESLFPILKSKGFAGDVELLYIALKYNLEIKRIPVRLRNAAPSSVKLSSHPLEMLGSISTLKLNWHLGHYESSRLREIANQRYWTEVSE